MTEATLLSPLFLLFHHRVVSNSGRPHGLGCTQASLSLTISWSLPKFMAIESVMPSNHLILSSPSPPALNLSQHQGLFQWVSPLHQVAKVLELQHQSFQWVFRVDFKIDWFDLLAVQGTLKSLLQHHSSKTSILQCSAFFIVQLSKLSMTTGKAIAWPYPWLFESLSAKWRLCFLTHCLGLSQLSYQEAIVF